MDTRSVLFVDHTPGSRLATQLRWEEAKLAEMTGYKIKIVERAGETD